MKKLALFLGGTLVGFMGCCALIALGDEVLDETIHETDEYTIEKTTNRNKNLDVAIIRYK